MNNNFEEIFGWCATIAFVVCELAFGLVLILGFMTDSFDKDKSNSKKKKAP